MYLVSLHGHLTSAWPRLERVTDGVQGRHEVGVELGHPVEHVGAHPGHHAHRGGDVRRVGELDAEHRLLGVEVAHHERDDVHGAAAHAAVVQPAHEGLHLLRVHPVVGRAGVALVDRADVGAVLDARDVDRVAGGVEGVRLDRRVQLGEGAGGDQRVGELGPLLVGAGAPVDAVGLGHRGDLVDEVEDALVGGRVAGGRGGCLRVGGHRLFLLASRSLVRPASLSATGGAPRRRCRSGLRPRGWGDSTLGFWPLHIGSFNGYVGRVTSLVLSGKLALRGARSSAFSRTQGGRRAGIGCQVPAGGGVWP